MFIEIGPASISIDTIKKGRQDEPDQEKVKEKLSNIIKDINECLPVLKQKAYKIKNTDYLPSIAKNMINAVKMVDEYTLTPMAAVAGAVSDEIKGLLKEEDFDFISVNNGGDISVFSNLQKPVKASIGDINHGRNTPYMLVIERLKDFGIATSGLGGRSFTLGVAEIGTVIAETGAIADAAATFICNRTNIESDNILRQKAKDIDPMTDIPDELVTIDINKLNHIDITNALQNGLKIANKYKNNKVIYDALIYIKGNMVTTITGDKFIKLEVLDGY